MTKNNKVIFIKFIRLLYLIDRNANKRDKAEEFYRESLR